jgi:hypothetical protein
MRYAVTEFASLMDGAGSFRSAVAPDAARERKLSEKPPHPIRVLALVRVDLGIASLQ